MTEKLNDDQKNYMLNLMMRLSNPQEVANLVYFIFRWIFLHNWSKYSY